MLLPMLNVTLSQNHDPSSCVVSLCTHVDLCAKQKINTRLIKQSPFWTTQCPKNTKSLFSLLHVSDNKDVISLKCQKYAIASYTLIWEEFGKFFFWCFLAVCCISWIMEKCLWLSWNMMYEVLILFHHRQLALSGKVECELFSLQTSALIYAV